MNVLYLGGFKLPDKNAAAHRVLANSKILRELGHKVYLVGQTDDVINSKELKALEYDDSSINMYSKVYPNSTLEWLKYITDIEDIKKYIKKFNINIVILYNYPSFATLRLLSFLNDKKIKVYGDITEWYGKSEGNFIKRFVKDTDTNLRMKYLNFKLDGLICISQYLIDYYENCNTILVPPLVDLNEGKWKEISGFTKNKIEPITFVYAGQLGGEKDNIRKVIEILVNLKNEIGRNFIFKIVGITKQDYLVLNEIDEIDESIIFFGRLSHLETLKEIKSSDFVVFFREKNKVNMAGFPTKFVESMACGIPVITNRTSNISDYLIDDYNGYFIDDNIKKTLNKILLLNQEEINNLKKNSLNTKSFNYLNFINDFKKILEIKTKKF